MNKYFATMVIAFVIFLQSVLYSEQIRYVKISVDENHLKELIKLGIEPEHPEKSPTGIQMLVSKTELQHIESSKIPYSVVISDVTEFFKNRLTTDISTKSDYLLGVENFRLGNYGGFYPLDSIYLVFGEMKKKFPQYFKKETIIGYSVEDRPIYSYSIGNTDDKSKPEILLTALHHAREATGMMALVFYFWQLFEKAEKGDPEANYLLNERAITVVPVVNPDGYYFNQITEPDGGGLWRKNRRKNNDTAWGVDLNRNYGPYEYWNAPNFGSSEDPDIDTYRGPSPFSEPEIQAISELCKQHNFKFAINYHTYSNLIIYPYSALDEQTPDSLYLRNLSYEMSKFNNYYQGTDNFTVGYATRGSSDDYMYKPEADKPKILALTVEVGNVADNFWPLRSRIITLCQENVYLLDQLLWSADENIRVRDYKTEFIKKPDGNYSCKAKVDLINLGLNKTSSGSTFSLKSLNENVTFDNPERTITLNSNEITSEEFIINLKENSVSNGSVIKALSIINEKNISRTDTIFLPVFNYYTSDIFRAGQLAGNWKLGKWGTVYDSLSGEFVLNDSPKGLYKDLETNYMQMNDPVSINFPAYLEFNTRFELEPHYDIGTVEISTNNGVSWEYIKTNKMVDGYGLKDSRHLNGMSGFSGYMPFWIKQEASLLSYLNKNIIFRFGVLTDNGRNMDGFFLKDINVRNYDSTKFTEVISNEKNKSYNNFEKSLIKKGDEFQIEIPMENLQNSQIAIDIFDLNCGNIINQKLQPINGKIRLNTVDMNLGVYLIVIKTKDKANLRTLLIIE